MAGRSTRMVTPRRAGSETLERQILTLRGRKVLLDADLAAVFGVATRELNQTARRNKDRLPGDFMIRLTQAETKRLRSQIVISNGRRGGRRHLPLAFTEHGAIMLASLVSSPTAILASIQVVRAFVRLRSALATTEQILDRLTLLEVSCDKRFRVVFQAIRALLKPSDAAPKRQIGFASPAHKGGPTSFLSAYVKPPESKGSTRRRAMAS